MKFEYEDIEKIINKKIKERLEIVSDCNCFCKDYQEGYIDALADIRDDILVLDICNKYNIRINEKFYGIIEKNNDIYEITIKDINPYEKTVMILINKKSQLIYCKFEDIKDFIFKTKEEAENQITKKGIKTL